MNEKGFVYPTALCLFLLMMTLFLLQVSVSVSEQRMLHEAEIQETRQFLLLRASEQMKKNIQGVSEVKDGVLFVDSVSIPYTILNVSTTQMQVSFILKHEGVQIQAVAVYEKGTGKLVNWLVPV